MPAARFAYASPHSDHDTSVDASPRIRKLFALIAFGILLVELLAVYPRQLIISGSMSPTVPIGSVMIADRFGYLTHQPKREDLVVFAPVSGISETQWSHRVIGLPGDTVAVKDGHYLVNGSAIPHGETTDPDDSGTVVPADSLFQKGDDADALNCLVPKTALIAKVVWY